MAAWFVPTLKAILPHIGAIISAATPVFTKKRMEATANQTALLQDQISELQTAAAQNAAHIKELAEQIQNTVATLEQAASLVESRLLRAQRLSYAALAAATVAVGAAVFVIVSH